MWHKPGKKDKDKRIYLKCQENRAREVLVGLSCSLNCRVFLFYSISGRCCLSGDVSMLRSWNRAAADLETSVFWDAGIGLQQIWRRQWSKMQQSGCCGSGDVSVLRCRNQVTALSCLVLLVSLINLKRAVRGPKVVQGDFWNNPKKEW